MVLVLWATEVYSLPAFLFYYHYSPVFVFCVKKKKEEIIAIPFPPQKSSHMKNAMQFVKSE